jgi:predicted ATPase
MHSLEHITIKGFKSIASIEKLPLGPINVVIGANGSGKSNLLQAFAFLRAISEGKLRNYVTRRGGAERLLHFGSKGTAKIELKLGFSQAVFGMRGYWLRFKPTDDDGLFPEQEILFPHVGEQLELAPVERRREAGISEPEHGSLADDLREYLGKLRVHHLNDTSSSSPIRKTAKLDDNRVLKADGSNLAPFLYSLRARHEDSYRAIVQEVRRVAPFFRDFILEPLEIQPSDTKLEWRHAHSDRYFDASSLSDGTLRFIALATLLLQPEQLRPPLILVDEPELGLHPYAMTILAALVRQASTKAQIILCTQSPTFLDHFEPGEVLVAELVNDATTLTRLEDEPLKEWLEDYSLGQLWEKNELGGRPVPA